MWQIDGWRFWGNPWRSLVENQRCPLRVWREGVFKLLGDCVGQTLEVDHRTTQQEDLLFDRVKVLRDETRRLPKEIFLWMDDIQVPVTVEVDPVVPQREGYSQ